MGPSGTPVVVEAALAVPAVRSGGAGRGPAAAIVLQRDIAVFWRDNGVAQIAPVDAVAPLLVISTFSYSSFLLSLSLLRSLPFPRYGFVRAAVHPLCVSFLAFSHPAVTHFRLLNFLRAMRSALLRWCAADAVASRVRQASTVELMDEDQRLRFARWYCFDAAGGMKVT